MLFSDLTLILTIMINTLVLHQSSAAVIIPGKGQPNLYPRGDLKSFNHLNVNEKTRRFPGRSERMNKTRQWKWFMEPVVLKLDTVIDKYNGEKDLIETIYSGVRECGLDKCEKFQRLIPKNQIFHSFKCFKKRVLKKLLKFHRGIQKIEESLQILINFETEMSHFYNRSRRNLLHDLSISIKMLNLEVRSVMRDERLNFSLQPETFNSSRIPYPDSETHLIINEWRIIQDSKRFLQDWQKNFEKIFKCWKKRKKEKRKRKRLSRE